MADVISVRYRSCGKTYFFDPNGVSAEVGEVLLVETSKGPKLGECVASVHTVADESVVQPLRPVIRKATAEDFRTEQLNKEKEKQAFATCEEKIQAHGLDMKLVDVEYSFDGSKILFFFTSDGRVDFRELVKDLASVFHTRIELRQIGVRDSAKMLGGLGICGRPFCCSTFLDDFQPVSIRMAKTQNLSLNPTKISGTCGRLMCCLKYEQDAYESLLKTMPKVEAAVDTPKGKGTVTEVNLLRRTVKVRLVDAADNAVQSYHVDQLGYTIGGEYVEPKPEEELPTEKHREEPDLSLYMADEPHPIGGQHEDRNNERRRERGGHNRNKPHRSHNEERDVEEPEYLASREKPDRREGEPRRYDRKKNMKPHAPVEAYGDEKPFAKGSRSGKNPYPPKNIGQNQQGNSQKPMQAKPPKEDGEKKNNSFRYHRHYRGNKKSGSSGDNGGNTQP